MVGIEGHGFFLIDVFSRLKRGNEVERMLVLRRGDKHGVNGFIVEQAAEIRDRRGLWNDGTHFLEPARVNVRDGDAFNIRTPKRHL